jgi:sec-independent protein translocase protein TatA
MFANLNGWHALIVVVVILLLFGAPKIPALARSLGQSMRILKTEIRDEGGKPTSPQATAAPAAARDADAAA